MSQTSFCEDFKALAQPIAMKMVDLKRPPRRHLFSMSNVHNLDLDGHYQLRHLNASSSPRGLHLPSGSPLLENGATSSASPEAR